MISDAVRAHVSTQLTGAGMSDQAAALIVGRLDDERMLRAFRRFLPAPIGDERRKPLKQRSDRTKVEIPPAVRWVVWERDDFRCQHCGSRHFLTVGHIYPESKGGTLALSNLQTLCRSCNSRKGAR